MAKLGVAAQQGIKAILDVARRGPFSFVPTFHLTAGNGEPNEGYSVMGGHTRPRTELHELIVIEIGFLDFSSRVHCLDLILAETDPVVVAGRKLRVINEKPLETIVLALGEPMVGEDGHG